jgi:ACT domain-containing protein
MMINLEVRLADTPGNLVELIQPISNNGGNIFGILHHHDKIINNLIPVSVSFELSEEIKEISLKNIQKELSDKNIQIDKVTIGKDERNLTVILTGHVFDTDVTDTIKRLAKKDIKVSELQAKFTEISEVSNVKLKIIFPESITREESIIELEKICKEKNLFLLRT